MKIFIKYLPKDILLYQLWYNARPSHYFYYCPEYKPILTLEQAKDDINNMLANGSEISLASYNGKLLYIKLHDDYFDPIEYDMYNGYGTASRIINDMKKEELRNVILSYYKYF